MLKQAVRYTDFDDKPQIKVLLFNLTKTELTENLDLRSELEDLQQDFLGEDKRELEEKEIRRLLELVKRLMRMSYGVRSADGERFIKSPQQYEEFTQTAAYDAFLFGLFEDPNNAIAFMSGILPKDLREAALEAANHTGNGVSSTRTAEVMAAQQEQANRAEQAAQARMADEFAKVSSSSPEGTPLRDDINQTLRNISQQATGGQVVDVSNDTVAQGLSEVARDNGVIAVEANGRPILSQPNPTEAELVALTKWMQNN